jgi:hypothetical protein
VDEPFVVPPLVQQLFPGLDLGLRRHRT